MTASLTPALVPAYLATLSGDIRACAVLDRSGAVAAGDPAVGQRAARLLAASEPGERAARGPGSEASGSLLAVRGERFTVAVEAGPLALAAVLTKDLTRVVASLSGR